MFSDIREVNYRACNEDFKLHGEHLLITSLDLPCQLLVICRSEPLPHLNMIRLYFSSHECGVRNASCLMSVQPWKNSRNVFTIAYASHSGNHALSPTLAALDLPPYFVNV